MARKFLYLVAAIIMLVIAGGFVIAFSEVMLTYAWKKVVTYLVPDSLAPDGLLQLMSTDYKFAVSFAILILFMIWLYLSWLVLLFGASVAFYVQHPEYLYLRGGEPRLSNRMRELLGLEPPTDSLGCLGDVYK